MQPPRRAPYVGGTTPRVVLTLAVVRALAALAEGMMVPFIIVWAIDHVGLSVRLAGLMFVMQAVGESIGGVVGGHVADRLGHRRILLVSLGGMSIGYGSLGLVHHGAAAFGLFFLAGLFESAFHPTIAALVSESTSVEQRRRGFATVRTGAGLGRIAGPVAGAGVALLALPWVFAAAAFVLVVTVGVAWSQLPRPTGPTSSRSRAEPPEGALAGGNAAGSLTALMRDSTFGVLVLGCAALSVTYTWWQADGLVILNEQTSIGVGAVGLLFALEAGALVLLQVPIVRLTEGFSSGTVLLAGAAVQGAGLLILVSAPLGYPVLVVAALLIATGQMLYGPTVSTVVSDLAPRGNHAAYQGALSVAEDIGASLGPTSGLLLASGGPPGFAWALAAPLCLVAGLASRWASRARTGGPA